MSGEGVHTVLTGERINLEVLVRGSPGCLLTSLKEGLAVVRQAAHDIFLQ